MFSNNGLVLRRRTDEVPSFIAIRKQACMDIADTSCVCVCVCVCVLYELFIDQHHVGNYSEHITVTIIVYLGRNEMTVGVGRRA